MSVSFACSKSEVRTIVKIAQRAEKLAEEYGFNRNAMDLDMDITACHCNGCPLDLERLLKADDFNFGHDVFGIHRHLDRKTGQLQDCFLPRYAVPE